MLADDLGWQDVSYHGGNIATPNIDQLASRGVQLDQFYVQSVCTPTRAGLMTGRYPIRLGLQSNVVRPWAQHGLPLDEQTLPTALKANGYTTSIVGKWHLGHAKAEYLPLQRGFDSQYGHYNGGLDYFSHIRDGGHDWHRNDQANYDEGYTTDLIRQEASRIIEEHNTDKPLFLYVPFNAPHSPYQAPKDQLERNKHIEPGRRQTYAAMVTSMDDAVGRIVETANRYLPKDNTLLFFCSDNGGITAAGSNGELRSEKSYIYEGGVRVPAIMVWDGTIKAGSLVSEPLHITDLYPTLLGITGSNPKQIKPLDGKDAWPTITRGKPSPHNVILLDSTPFRGAIRLGDWKLVRNGEASAIVTTSTGKETWELFNLKNDPFEKTNVQTKNPNIFKKLKKKLEELAGQAVAPHMPANKLPEDFKVPKVWGHPEETL
jgi:arylsulfatase A-like enzyme